jgi:hypothetical protein
VPPDAERTSSVSAAPPGMTLMSPRLRLASQCEPIPRQGSPGPRFDATNVPAGSNQVA